MCNSNPIMEIYEMVAEKTKKWIEKEIILSEETYRMISLVQSLYNSLQLGVTPPEIF